MAAWGYIAAAAASAAAGLLGSKMAADAQKEGAKGAVGEQRRQFNTGMAMLEPSRALGYGALSDLAGLYGYALPGYMPLNSLLTAGGVNLGKHASTGGGVPGGTAFGGPITVAGRSGDGGDIMGQDINPLNHAHRKFGGTIDPVTGTVNLTNIKSAKKEARLEDAASAYLRGETDKLKGKKLKRIRDTIDEMRDQGYSYDPNAATALAEAPPTAGIAGQPGNFDRFFASPDYQFRLNEGTNTLQQSAAARGGLFSGNTGRATVEYGSNVAAGEYGNYVNRLLAMAGLGQTATNTGVQLGQNTANAVGSGLQNIGDARASGIMGAANSITGSINSGMNMWLLNQYLNKGP